MPRHRPSRTCFLLLTAAGVVVAATRGWPVGRDGGEEPPNPWPTVQEATPPEGPPVPHVRAFGSVPEGEGPFVGIGWFAAAYHQASGRLAMAHAGGRVDLWDAADGRNLGGFVTGRAVQNAAAFRPDGTLAVAVEGGVEVWDVTRPQRVADLRHDTPQDNVGSLALALSPDGRYVLAGCRTPYAHAWEVESGRLLWRSPAELGGAGFGFHPDGRTALVPGERSINVGLKVTGWDLGSGRKVTEFVGTPPPRPPEPPEPPLPEGQFRFGGRFRAYSYDSVATSPCGRWVAFGGKEGRTDVFEVATGTCVRTIREAAKAVFSPCGRFILCQSGFIHQPHLHLYEVESGVGKAVFSNGGLYLGYGMGFLTGGRQVWAAEINNRILVWDVPPVAAG